MMAEMAAGYCGEKHVEDFLERVGKVYPAPRVVETVRRRFWYREDLDRAMNIGTGIGASGLGEKFRKAYEQNRPIKTEK
jgi:ribosomal protein L39E